MATVKAYKLGDSSAPSFSDEYEVTKKAVLQVTDLKTNRNKYYAIELHQAGSAYRVFTHYGRTDDLETNPDAGAKECRFFSDPGGALACYETIYREKTSKTKGYKEVSLASSRIGSPKARGTSSGDVDQKTLAKIAATSTATGDKPAAKASTLAPLVSDLVSYIYAEATDALTSTIAAKITAQGIETPLGVLTLGQIDRGEQILKELYQEFQAKRTSRMEELSGDFYTCIPHRLGRSRAAVQEAVIDTMTEFEQKQETLQLMRDMLNVSGDANVLFDSKADAQYEALKCELMALEHNGGDYRELEDFVLRTQVKSKNIKIRNIYRVKRPDEWSAFDTKVGNERQLFHGSRIKNWVGLLSRGILMPKIVVSMGVNRTDAGWLGNGIYFGDAACTSAFYTTPGKKGTRFLAIARVALGRMKDFTKITYGLNDAPAGFDSAHGVRNTTMTRSEFADDEYVVYRQNQQRLEALVEFAL